VYLKQPLEGVRVVVESDLGGEKVILVQVRPLKERVVPHLHAHRVDTVLMCRLEVYTEMTDTDTPMGSVQPQGACTPLSWLGEHWDPLRESQTVGRVPCGWGSEEEDDDNDDDDDVDKRWRDMRWDDHE
jgi:hypothetical protein